MRVKTILGGDCQLRTRHSTPPSQLSMGHFVRRETKPGRGPNLPTGNRNVVQNGSATEYGMERPFLVGPDGIWTFYSDRIRVFATFEGVLLAGHAVVEGPFLGQVFPLCRVKPDHFFVSRGVHFWQAPNCPSGNIKVTVLRPKLTETVISTLLLELGQFGAFRTLTPRKTDKPQIRQKL